MPSPIGADGIILDVPNRFMPGRKTVLEEPYIQGESDGQVKTLMFVTGEQINEATKQIQAQKREGNFRPVVLIEAKYSNYFQYVAMMGQPLDSVAVSSYLKNGDVQKVDKPMALFFPVNFTQQANWRIFTRLSPTLQTVTYTGTRCVVKAVIVS